MKAIVYSKYGLPNVLQLAEVETPTPGDNEVLIKVHAASINSWDWDRLTGKPYLYRLLFGILKPKLKIIGADVAGRIERVGKNISKFKAGDEVFGDLSGGKWGGFAEYVCTRENELAIKPAGMTFEDAAALPQAGVLALQGIRHKKNIQAGQKVLINGAGGGVGTLGIQMLKMHGVEITGVDRADKLDMLRALGADHVLDYAKEDYTKNGEKYNLIIDVVARRSVFDYKRALNTGGVFVMVGGSILRVLQVAFLGSWISKASRMKMGLLMHQPNPEDLEYLCKLYEAGKLIPIIDKRFTLDQVPEAMQYFGEGRVCGKIVIAIAE